MNKLFTRSAMAAAVTLALVGCGSSSSDGGAVNPPIAPAATETKQGVFLDSTVGGISYKTETQEGVTDSAGRYNYVEGESVTFSVGGLVLPAVKAKGVVTPADMTDNAATQTNILQALQSLDSDGDLSNGITIIENAAEVLKDIEFDLTDEAGFDTVFETALKQIDPTLEIVSEEDAEAHFEGTLKDQLLGSWIYSEGENRRNILTFFEGGRFIMIHEAAEPGEEDDPDGQSAGSAEYGEYIWEKNEDGEDGIALVEGSILESDGWGGLHDPDSDNGGSDAGDFIEVDLDSQTLTLTFDPNDADDSATFTRVYDASNPMIGGWLFVEGDQKSTSMAAIIRIGRKVGGWGHLAQVLRLVPARMQNRIYAVIARNRHRWFGRASFCDHPSPSLQHRLLK